MMANLSIKNLKVLYASVGIKPFIENGEVKVCIYKSIKESYMS